MPTQGAWIDWTEYDATSLGGLGSLVPPAHRDFALCEKATVTLQFPGVPTGTSWQVAIVCSWAGDPFVGAHVPWMPGHFDQTVTY